MPRNSTTGIYTAPDNSWNPAVAGTVIDPDDWNAQLADYEAAFTDSLSRTGEGGMEADLNMGGNAIVGGAEPDSSLLLKSTSNVAPEFDQIIFNTKGDDQWYINGNSAANADGQLRTEAGDWLETLIPSTVDVAQFASISPYAGFGILGASRTSDAPHFGFAVGVSAFAINDRTDGVGYYGNLATAYYAEARHYSTAPTNAITIVQENDIITLAGTATGSINPYDMFSDLTTANLWLSNGRPTISGADATVGIGLINNSGGTTTGRYSKGIVFDAECLVGSDGVTGTASAIAMAKGHTIEWYVTGQTTPQAFIRSTVANTSPTTATAGITFQDTGIVFGVGSGNGMALSPNGYLTVGGANGASGGRVGLGGATSGTVTLQANAIAGTPVFTFPTTGGTVATNSDNLSFFAATTSAQLAGVISDETGSGALVFGTSPVFTTGITVNGTMATNSTSATHLMMTSTDAGSSVGPVVTSFRNSASPAIGDNIGAFYMQGNSSTGVLRSYGAIETRIVDPTNAAETGRLQLTTTAAGTYAVRLAIEAGVTVGPVSTDPGVGNLLVTNNATIGGTLRINQTPTAVSGAGPIAIGSASTINTRIQVNMNGTTYWIPASTTAF